MKVMKMKPWPREVRSLPAFWPHRQLRNVVFACLDAAELGELGEIETELHDLNAVLSAEVEAGPVSAVLGRPSVTVASRFGEVGWYGAKVDKKRVLDALYAFEIACPECGPQAWGDPGFGAYLED